MRPTSALARPTWRLGTRSGHIALEWTASDVRAEGQEGDERSERDQRVRARDPDEEYGVEEGTDDDVGLSAPPPGRGVVADRADGGLDERSRR